MAQMTRYRILPRFGGVDLQAFLTDAGGVMRWIPLGVDGRPSENGWYTTGSVQLGLTLSYAEAKEAYAKATATRRGDLADLHDLWIGVVVIVATLVTVLWWLDWSIFR